jgi:hypothetical protein
MSPANTTGADDSSLSTQAGREVEGGMVTNSEDLATPSAKKVEKNSRKFKKRVVTYCKQGS